METKKQLLNSSLRLDKYSPKCRASSALRTGSVVMSAFCLALFVTPVCSAANQEIVRQYQQRIIDNPKDVDAHLKLAMEYGVSNNYVKAVETYFAVLRIDPNNFHAYNNLGILYKQAGQFRDSLHCYQQAQRIDPDSSWVPYNMGLCYEAMGRMQEARESYGMALSLNPSFSQALQRLRFLSTGGGNGAVPSLPGLEESQIYIADSTSRRPVIREQNNSVTVAPVVATKVSKPEDKKTQAVSVAKDKQERVSERLSKEKKAAVSKYRTSRKGSAAIVFNQAMDALEGGKMELAIELYVNSVIAERDLLAEPENGIIRQGLTFLKDRPNRMANGIFFRGLLIYISGHLDLAVGDMKSFIEINSNSEKSSSIRQYLEEARRIVARYELEKEAEAIAAAERAAAKLAAVATSSIEQAVSEEVARPSDYQLKRMDTEQIIQEADRLSRESMLTDAVAVLENGLSRDPDNVALLMKSANAYTDMLLLKGDNEAGKMALSRFRKVVSFAQANSKESAVAKEMIEELNKRVRQ